MAVMTDDEACARVLNFTEACFAEVLHGDGRSRAQPSVVGLPQTVVRVLPAIRWWQEPDRLGGDGWGGWLNANTDGALVNPAWWYHHDGTRRSLGFALWFPSSTLEATQWLALLLDAVMAATLAREFSPQGPTEPMAPPELTDSLRLASCGANSARVLRIIQLATTHASIMDLPMDSWRVYLETWMTHDYQGRLTLFADMSREERVALLGDAILR